MVDDNVLNGNENQKNDGANHIIASDDEIAKGFDHATCGRRAAIAVEQNQACRTDIERQAE